MRAWPSEADARPHDRLHRPLLGCQRDLAGAGRRAAAGGLPGGAWHDPDRALPARRADAGRADRCAASPSSSAPRRRTRAEAALGPCLPGGSLLAALSPGLDARAATSWASPRAGRRWPSPLAAVGLVVPAYAFIGAAWLIWRTEGALQRRAVGWARRALVADRASACSLVSVATPLASPRIFDRWFALPELLVLAPLPLVTGALFAGGGADPAPHAAARRRAATGALRGAVGCSCCASRASPVPSSPMSCPTG